MRKKPTVYHLIKKLTETELGKGRGTAKEQVIWARYPFAPKSFKGMVIRFSPLDGKLVFPDMTFTAPIKRSTKRYNEQAEAINGALERFAQKSTQKEHFLLGAKIALTIASYHQLRDIYLTSEAALHIPTKGGPKMEVGRRDIFLHGFTKNRERMGISIEIEKELKRSSIRKFLYGLHEEVFVKSDALHKTKADKAISTKLLHNVLVTKNIGRSIRDVLNLEYFDGTKGLAGTFEVGDALYKIKKDPKALEEVAQVGMDRDILNAKDVVALHRIRERIEKQQRKLGNGKKDKPSIQLNKRERDRLIRVLTKLSEANLDEHAIDFTISDDVIRIVKHDKDLMKKIGEYIITRPFPKKLKKRITDNLEDYDRLSDITLKESLDYMAAHARKSLQRSIIVHVPTDKTKKGKEELLPEKTRIIEFKRIGKTYQIVPVIWTMDTYLDKVTKGNWKKEAKSIDKKLEELESEIESPKRYPAAHNKKAEELAIARKRSKKPSTRRRRGSKKKK